MAAYLIADITITDPAGFEEYRRQVAPTIAAFGGKYLVRGGKTEPLEGNWNPKRFVIIEFESAARAREWYHSDAYRPAMALRHKSAQVNLLLVEGVSP